MDSVSQAKNRPKAVVAASGREERNQECALLIAAVVVDQAAVCDDLALRLGQIAGGDGESGDGAVRLHGVGIEDSVIGQNMGPDAGDEDVIAQVK